MISDPFTVSGTLSAESALGLIVTLRLPVTEVNTARTMMNIIIVCRKTQMLEKRKAETTSVKECRQGNDPPASVELCNRGGGGSREKRLSRSCCLPGTISLFFLCLTKQTAPLYLVLFYICSHATHLRCQPLNVSTPSTRRTD